MHRDGCYSKLGSAVIPNDPYPQSNNGRILEQVINMNDLVVVNASTLCEGTITRRRVTQLEIEAEISHSIRNALLQLHSDYLKEGFFCKLAREHLLEYFLEILEKCDKIFFTKLFSVPQTCSYEAFFYETNALPIRFILIGRRLMYDWQLLNKADNELAKQVPILWGWLGGRVGGWSSDKI